LKLKLGVEVEGVSPLLAKCGGREGTAFQLQLPTSASIITAAKGLGIVARDNMWGNPFELS
jgi:hypothetical protein